MKSWKLYIKILYEDYDEKLKTFCENFSKIGQEMTSV